MAKVGGARPGAGRKPGSANVKTRELADQAARDGITPLEYMLRVLRDESAEPGRRDDMAKAAAPYMHPRLQTTTLTGPQGKAIAVTLTRDDSVVL